ncbi:MAG: protein-tyrosine-phosphatase [Bacteroidia bacterium]|nr:protein-tyrosine-phosphatase [Bacteroidia bacterium]NND10751.1 protein-tyrosine-phosphatase [Flavobacteriaceae bacterium]MBT8309213.1 protein-tyrosine-phosphatase [Bacteroidia bacterium]NNK27736.1 protein-tyrosine-phosphatase [Flavobacteriaceae bacterium]NNL61348.1 protein-tyrosine-phosphatase [Flavobacteriaceae bacterium]
MFETITEHIKALDISSINEERKETLQQLIDYIKNKITTKDPIRLNFICTHNSRRSHLSQIWAQTMAAFYKLDYVNCYSGGTEATAMFPKVGETLANQGFKIKKLSENDNPVYSVKYADNEPAIIAFSKRFEDEFNPRSGFAAIMTCSSADEGCPLVNGCDKRIAITYEDPKKSDGTPQQTETYFNRSLQIATEMKFVFSSL